MKYVFSCICLCIIAQVAHSQDTFSRQLSSPLKGLSSKKWSLSTFQGFSAGFLRGYSNFSVPMGAQITRPINKNLFAFGAVSVAPSYINFNRSFLNADFTKSGPNNFFRAGNLGINPRAEVGLGYTNDARTFSISGSIGIERNSYNYGYGAGMPYQVLQPINRVGYPY